MISNEDHHLCINKLKGTFSGAQHLNLKMRLFALLRVWIARFNTEPNEWHCVFVCRC